MALVVESLELAAVSFSSPLVARPKIPRTTMIARMMNQAFL